MYKRAIARKKLSYRLKHLDMKKIFDFVMEALTLIALFGLIFILPHFLH